METQATRQDTLLIGHKRLERRVERQQQVLRFLRGEIWSSTELLGQVMQIKTAQGSHKALLSMAHEKLICRHQVGVFGRKALSIWGITPHGQAMAFDLESEEPLSAYFEPSRISLSSMEHHLDVQRVRLIADRAGWVDWVPGARLGRSAPDSKRPDAIARSTDGVMVAFEIERTIKSYKRYEAIMSHYLQEIKAGEFGYVQYLSPTVNFSRRLERVFKKITAVPVQGARIPLKEEHYQSFRFNAYDDWI